MLKSLVLVFALVTVLMGVSGCGGGLGSTASTLVGTPVILSISPNPVVRGQTITITGTNLNGSLTTAWFNGTQSNASSGGTTSVTVTVPTTITAGTYSIYVVTNDGQGDFSPQSNSITLSVQ